VEATGLVRNERLVLFVAGEDEEAVLSTLIDEIGFEP
jgi:predicted dinucleotide-binding enzyme